MAVRLVSNPPNPWLSTHVEWLEEPPAAQLEVYEEEARSVLTRNDSPDISFRWSVNPYRGCQHACAYCYARPTHQYMGLGAGTDFDTRIVVKTNAPRVLRKELARRGWRREVVAFSGVTDCYQPLEASYGLTRACLEACLEARTPVGVITKSALVRRDAHLLARLAAITPTRVYVSIPFADERQARLLEPLVGTPATRFETLRRLSEAGVPTGVGIAPLIPGLTESQVPEILERARAAGATRAFMVLLRLPLEVKPVFEQRLREALPERAEHVLSAVRDMRGGKSNESRFGARMRGTGARWQAVLDLFELQKRRLGFDSGASEEDALPEEQAPGAPPARERQGLLFD